MKERKVTQLLRKRLSEDKPLIQVLVGPRQVGKTTAVQSVLKQKGIQETADYPTPLAHSIIENWWEKAVENSDKILFIDEIQKIPGWSEVLKRLWDKSKRTVKVVITGSSTLLIEKGLKETLSGRYELIRVEHWNYEEAQTVFGLELKSFVEFGCYPGAIPFLKEMDRWGAYVRDSIVEPAIGRDLLQLHPVEQPALLRQIFGLALALPAQLVSLSKLQGQLHGKGTLPTIQNYLRLLSDVFLISGVEKYSPSSFRTRKSTQKLIIHDNGLMRAFERPIQSDLDPKLIGHYFENQIGARFIESGWDTFYWKDRDLEVDFVVIGPQGERYAIEVKTSQVTEKDLSGTKEFCRRNPKFTPCLVSLISQKMPGFESLDPKTILSLSRKY